MHDPLAPVLARLEVLRTKSLACAAEVAAIREQLAEISMPPESGPDTGAAPQKRAPKFAYNSFAPTQGALFYLLNEVDPMMSIKDLHEGILKMCPGAETTPESVSSMISKYSRNPKKAQFIPEVRRKGKGRVLPD